MPRDWREADDLDEKNGNKKWENAKITELSQLDDYDTFDKRGLGEKAPQGYKRINVHLIYDIKHDLRHKARLVAGGHLTDPSKEQAYSGVVSLRTLRVWLVM